MSIPLNSSADCSDDAGVLFRSLNGLPETQASVIEEVVPSLPGNWSVERCESCDGNLSLVLTLEDDAPMAVSLTVDQDSLGLNLGVLRGDEFTTYGHYDIFRDLVSALHHLASFEAASITEAGRLS